jgi:hypothetical protein
VGGANENLVAKLITPTAGKNDKNEDKDEEL